MTEKLQECPAKIRDLEEAIILVRGALGRICEGNGTQECRQNFVDAMKMLVVPTEKDPFGLNCFLDFCLEYLPPEKISQLVEEFLNQKKASFHSKNTK